MSNFDCAGIDPIIVLLMFYIAARYGFRCWNRLMRHLNVRKHGWPPEHLAADGDFRRGGQ
jgi:hypothetical protein